MAPSAEPLMAAVLLLLAAVPVALASNVTYTVANDTGLNSSNLTKPNFTDHLPSRASGLKGEREAKMVKSVKYQRAAAHRLNCTVNTKTKTTGNRNRRELKKLPILRIKVHFIVINDGTRKTNVTMKTLAAQVASTNKVLRGIETEDKKNRGKTSAPFDKAVDTRLEIVLAGKPKYVTNKEQHRCMPKNQEAIKAAHASNPTNQVNIIICKTLMNNGKAMLGWSMFPVSKTKLGVPIKPSSNQWGMFIEYKSLPGYNSRYSGDTLTHELGHFFGLYHTFWEGIGTQCKFDNDYKGDTGLTNAPGYGCKKGSRSCPGVTTYDPIWNIMDYSDDACMFSFSEQQGVEMHTQIELHKKDLYKASKKLGETSRLIPFNSAKCLKQWNNGTTVSSKNAAATTNATTNTNTNTNTNATTGYGRLRRADETTGASTSGTTTEEPSTGADETTGASTSGTTTEEPSTGGDYDWDDEGITDDYYTGDDKTSWWKDDGGDDEEWEDWEWDEEQDFYNEYGGQFGDEHDYDGEYEDEWKFIGEDWEEEWEDLYNDEETQDDDKWYD